MRREVHRAGEEGRQLPTWLSFLEGPQLEHPLVNAGSPSLFCINPTKTHCHFTPDPFNLAFQILQAFLFLHLQIAGR